MIKSEEAKQRIANIAAAICHLPRFQVPSAAPMTADEVLSICSAASGIDIELLGGKLKHNKDLHFVCIQYACIWALWHFTNEQFGVKRYINCWNKTIQYALEYTMDCIKGKNRVYPMVLEIIAGCMAKNRIRVETLYVEGMKHQADAQQQEVQRLLKESFTLGKGCLSCKHFSKCPQDCQGSISQQEDTFCPKLPYDPNKSWIYHGADTRAKLTFNWVFKN